MHASVKRSHIEIIIAMSFMSVSFTLTFGLLSRGCLEERTLAHVNQCSAVFIALIEHELLILACQHELHARTMMDLYLARLICPEVHVTSHKALLWLSKQAAFPWRAIVGVPIIQTDHVDESITIVILSLFIWNGEWPYTVDVMMAIVGSRCWAETTDGSMHIQTDGWIEVSFGLDPPNIAFERMITSTSQTLDMVTMVTMDTQRHLWTWQWSCALKHHLSALYFPDRYHHFSHSLNFFFPRRDFMYH